ncbi:MAG: glycyl-radical enzyme activating protein [Clostridia bacterium]|nr:glycyl-radical enzyme activating protein [Clostridia bacterium]
MKGRIFNVQQFCINDGPGIRTTVFLKGCPLRCAWCHNPESQRAAFEIMWNPEKCVFCGNCASACPQHLHTVTHEPEPRHIFSRPGCVGCGLCAEKCYTRALELCGREADADEIMKTIVSNREFYITSGGGATISGGEPLFQPEFTKELAQRCHEEGISVCLETSGYASESVLKSVMEHIDMVLWDYKVTGEEKHRQYTGVSNKMILDNLDMICERGKRVILRCPIIPGVNMIDEHFEAIASIGKKYKSIEKIHLMPYHPLGVSKNEYLGQKQEYENNEFLNRHELADAAEKIELLSAKKVEIQ